MAKRPTPEDIVTLTAYSEQRISRDEAIERLELRDYASLLVALGHADLPLPSRPPEAVEDEAAIFVELWKGP